MKVKPFSLPMKAAIAFWKDKVLLSPEQFAALADKHKAMAFTVSGLAAMDQIMAVNDSIQQALEEGVTFEEWKESLSDVWEEAGWAEKPYRIKNIYRTNIQTAYSIGRYKQLKDSAPLRPFWRYDAVNDSKTRASHADKDGKIYHHEHPFWDTWYPLNGYQCRCSVTNLSERQMRAQGLIEQKVGVSDKPDEGFQSNPAKEGFKPDLSKYPEKLQEAFRNYQKKEQ